MGNKKGSTSVFLVFILTAIIALTAAFIHAAKQAAIASYGDGILNLAGRTVLSEFELEVKDRYGLFAFENSGKEVKARIKKDADYALQLNKDVRTTSVNINFAGHSLGDTGILKKEILTYMKFVLAENLIKDIPEQTGITESGKDRTLRNRKIIDYLPSEPLKVSSPGFQEWLAGITDQLGSVEDFFDKSKDSYLLDKYILLHFKNALGGSVKHDTFFSNEVEYILEGDYSNRKNKAEIRKGIVLLRSGLNAVYLYMDSEKRAQTLAAAELITPGPPALLTQAVIIGTWALAEAENDARLLDKGRPVVFFKDKSAWATDLDSVLNNISEGCIDTGCDKGLSYQEYLMVFLHFENENLKLTRVMDLIQINMKGTYNRDFLIKTFHCGLQLNAEINGRKHRYEITY